MSRATRIGPSRAAGKISICVEQAGMSEVDIPVFYVSQVAGRYCVAVKKGDTKIVLFVNLIVQ